MAATRTGGAPTGQLGALFSLGAAGGLTDGQLLDRFLAREDPAASEAAFAELVDRHGALVLSVCRRELRDPHDASDAFQATFLVLVSNAGALRHWQTVGGWLVGVARRVSARMRFETARRRRHLARVGADRGACEPDSLVAPSIGDEPDYAPLIAEVDRLPERFRAPVVLHYLEGLSTEATALRLGCARGTVLSRLSRARDRLRRRLEARGYDPIVVLPARWLPPELVPTALVHDTLRATGSLGLAGAAIDGVVPATVAHLSRRVARAMAVSRIGVAASIIVLAAAGMSIALAATLNRDDGIQQGPAMERASGAIADRPAPQGVQPASAEVVVIRGRVVDPDGQPARGADILLDVREPRPDGSAGPQRVGHADADGRFQLTVPRTNIEPEYGIPSAPMPRAVVGAAMRGMGPAWTAIRPGKRDEPCSLQLRRDDTPIEGRFIDLEGRPLGGLTVTVIYIIAAPESLLSALANERGTLSAGWYMQMQDTFLASRDAGLAPVQTDPDGRFRIAGVGRDRIVLLNAEGAEVERTRVMVLTASDPAYTPVPLPAVSTGQQRMEGPRFQLALAPGRAIEGTVRDRDTGRPIAGANVRGFFGDSTKTDAAGRFRFAGQSRSGTRSVQASVDDQPYVSAARMVEDPGGPGPFRIDLTLKRGVWVRGRVIDATTGKPLHAQVTYHPARNNPRISDYPDATFLNNDNSDEPRFTTDGDGRYRAIALPGRGALTVLASAPGYVRKSRPNEASLVDEVFQVVTPGTLYSGQDLVPIDVPEHRALDVPDITLSRGPIVHLQLVDPEGRPVAGARVSCLTNVSLFAPVSDGDVSLVHANPGVIETVIIHDDARTLAAAVEVKGDEHTPIRVVLQPLGTVVGRLVDDDGKPRPTAHLTVGQRLSPQGGKPLYARDDPVSLNSDGRFRITGLIPGVNYNVSVIQPNQRDFRIRVPRYLQMNNWTIKPGETWDWGDVQTSSDGP